VETRIGLLATAKNEISHNVSRFRRFAVLHVIPNRIEAVTDSETLELSPKRVALKLMKEGGIHIFTQLTQGSGAP
jgi:hypothetical protein